MNKLIVMLLGLQALAAQAQNNFPEMSNVTNVGRVLAFPSVKKNVWFSPTAFSAKFVCQQTSNSCSIQIFNFLSDAEMAGLNQLSKARQELLFFNAMDARFVSQVKDQFTELGHAFNFSQYMLLDSLAQSEKFPYAQVQARMLPEDVALFQDLFVTTGLGYFETSFHLKGEMTEDYLEIEKTDILLDTLKTICEQPQSLSSIKSKIITALKQSLLITKNFTQDEAEVLAYRYIVMNYIEKKDGLYSISKRSLYNLPEKMVVIDETQEVKMSCKAQLKLKEGAVSTTVCNQE